jgi:hypothetical protein
MEEVGNFFLKKMSETYHMSLNTSQLVLRISNISNVFAEIHFLGFLSPFPGTSSRVSFHASLVRFHWSSFVSSYSIVSCRLYYLFFRLSWNVDWVSLLFSGPTLHLVCMLYLVGYFFKRGPIVITSRSWSDSISAPRITRTSKHDRLNFPLMHIYDLSDSVEQGISR